MNIVQLTSESIEELRKKRAEIVTNMIEDDEGSLLVIRPTYAGLDRKYHTVSYAIFMIFFDLWERFNFQSWSYTFDDEGLIFYIRLSESGEQVKDVLIHFEDHHPLGFSFDSEVHTHEGEITRSTLGYIDRIDKITQKPLKDIIVSTIEDKSYNDSFIKDIESYMVKGDTQTILSNIVMYGLISAITKDYGFGMYGPNFKGSNDQMNFEKFIYFLRAYGNEIRNSSILPNRGFSDIRQFQENTDKKIQQALLNQESYIYIITMTSLILFAFVNSRGYSDISNKIKQVSEKIINDDKLQTYPNRYNITKNGMKEMFNNGVPFLQKNKSIVATLLYILSRNEDQSIMFHNGEQNALKIQFLAKNLIYKPDKWLELDKFCKTHYIYPQDATTLVALTAMLDIMQRYYLKIKMLFDTAK